MLYAAQPYNLILSLTSKFLDGLKIKQELARHVPLDLIVIQANVRARNLCFLRFWLSTPSMFGTLSTKIITSVLRFCEHKDTVHGYVVIMA